MVQPADIEALRRESQSLLSVIQSTDALTEFQVDWLGRKGKLTNLLKSLGTLSIEEKRAVGSLTNQFKQELEALILTKSQALGRAALEHRLVAETLDLSLPGTPLRRGRSHPLVQVLEDLIAVFRSLGFVVADGPEMESEFYNFEALNVPADHPARDMQDTFYLELAQQQLTLPHIETSASRQESILLRTHTSPVQARIMEAYQPPIAIVVPGRVYRNEATDATHLAVFHQMEGLLVDENISFADLKGTLSRFAEKLFGPSVKTRFGPSFFPFTEPSAEMRISCVKCGGNGCRLCKETGWVEILGAGMVNPSVFRSVGIDPEKYTGFAFGIGIERIAMYRYAVEDLRHFYENDIRFLNQF